MSAYAAKVWGFPPELAILTGTATAAVCGLVAGSLAIRRQGIYFAMITLALAQMMYFFALQAKFTGGEDGIQARAARPSFRPVRPEERDDNVLRRAGRFSLPALLFIYRIIHSPFGEVLKAIRENETRAISLGYKTDRYKLLRFCSVGDARRCRRLRPRQSCCKSPRSPTSTGRCRVKSC